MAHIGVLKYLDEKSVNVTEVSGTSMGAIIAALFAFGHDWKGIQGIVENFAYRRYADLSFSLGVLKGKRIQSYLAELFENKTIGDAQIPLSIVACDIDM